MGTYGDFWGLYKTFWFFGGDFYGATICLASLINVFHWICGIFIKLFDLGGFGGFGGPRGTVKECGGLFAILGDFGVL